MPSQKQVLFLPQRPVIARCLYTCLPLITLVATPCQAYFDLAPYFALTPGNQLTYRHQSGGGAWVAGENSVIAPAESFYGTSALRRVWYDPGVTPGIGIPSSTEYFNITPTDICLYGAKSPSETILLNPSSPSSNPQGVCFPRNVNLGETFPRTVNLQIIGGSNADTYNNVSYTITIPDPQPSLAGASSAIYMTNGFQFKASGIIPVTVTRNSQTWLAYGTGLIRRYTSGSNGSLPITSETTEITAFIPAAGTVCKTDALMVNTTTFNTTTFGSGSHNWTSNVSITTQGAVTLPTGANVTFRSPLLRLNPGFRVTGGIFTGQIGTGVCSTAPIIAQAVESVEASTRIFSDPGTELSLESPQLFTVLDRLPGWIHELLDRQGIDYSSVRQALLDNNGQWLILETAQALNPVDGNGSSDIYRLDLVTESLNLLSRTSQGMAGNGPSRFPAADALGKWVAFQSDASDLSDTDNNGVTDIFLYDLTLDKVLLFTIDAQSASAHPALDAGGEELAWDQYDASGHRRILAANPLGNTEMVQLSLLDDDMGMPLDNHHPALSADGRFLAYIEEVVGGQYDRCQVHFFNRDSAHFSRLPCPTEVAASSEIGRAFFSPDGNWLEWDLGAEAGTVVMNPLVD